MINIKRKLLALILCTFILAGCADKTNDSTTDIPSDSTESEVSLTENETEDIPEESEINDEIIEETETSEEETEEVFDMVINDEASLRAAMATAWKNYTISEKKNEKRIAETTSHSKRNNHDIYSMTFGSATMKYSMEVVGEPDENGYPLYICLHGGGAGITPDINNQQWDHMMIYYRGAVENGIYVAARGVRDTYDCHSNPESYALYDELIENMILFENVDPNRVYLLGYSAGGDGVYQVSAKMSDRFAAVNMSAGHPNGVPLENLCNLPIALQCGANDTAYNRHTMTAEYGKKLDKLQSKLDSEHYIHSVFIHYNKPHGFIDNGSDDQTVMADYTAWVKGDTTTMKTDTNAVRFVSGYTRNPLPEIVEWNLRARADQRTPEGFYWLSADKNMNVGMIHAEYSKEENSVTISTKGVDDFSILISPDMLDMFKPITFNTPDGSAVITVEPSYDVIVETTAERGDINYQFATRVSYSEILSKIN